MKMVDNIPFECVQCGKCCRWSGYVFLTQEDIERMAEKLSDGHIDEFLRDYTEKYVDGYVLANKPNSKDCVFLKDNKCSVYGFKPQQCTDFPFEYDERCPGFRSKKEATMNDLMKNLKALNEKLAGGDFEKEVVSKLYNELQKDLSSTRVASQALDQGLDISENSNTIKVASLDDLFAFERVDKKQLIHKATRDLWNIEADENGEIQITRLFESGKPVKG